jgi:hypothetical protein
VPGDVTTFIAHRFSRCKRVGVAAVSAACGLTLAVACTGSFGSGGSPTSSPEEWRASVCDSGAAGSLNALAEGIDASDLHVCSSANADAGSVYVLSGMYSSKDRLQYYVTNHAAFRGNPYATASAPNGGVWAFVAFVDGIGSGSPAVALKPLSQFGFEIHGTISPSSQRRPQTTAPSVAAQPVPTPAAPVPSTRTPIPTGTVGSVTAFTRIDWAGTRCIEMSSARSNDPNQSGSGTVCSDNGSWEYSEHPVSGNLVGGDPVMGDATWISCKLYLNGKLNYSDRADAGDGTDVNCLRKLN